MNPKYNRNRQADAALKRAGIRCVVNLSDSEVAMKDYEGYGDTCYSTLDVLPLNLIVNYDSDAFRAGLAEGFRFIAENEGPAWCTATWARTGPASPARCWSA